MSCSRALALACLLLPWTLQARSRRMMQPEWTPSSLAFSADSAWLYAVGPWGQIVKVHAENGSWDYLGGKIQAKVHLDTARILPDGTVYATTGKNLRRFQAGTLVEEAEPIRVARQNFFGLSMDDTGEKILALDRDGLLHFRQQNSWQERFGQDFPSALGIYRAPKTGFPPRPADPSQRPIVLDHPVSIAVSANGQSIVVATESGKVLLVGDQRPPEPTHREQLTALAVSPEGDAVAVARGKKLILLQRAERFAGGPTLGERAAFELPHEIQNLAFSPLGKGLLVAGKDLPLLRFPRAAKAATEGVELAPKRNGDRHLALSPDGKWLVANDGMFGLRIRSLETGAVRTTIFENQGGEPWPPNKGPKPAKQGWFSGW